MEAPNHLWWDSLHERNLWTLIDRHWITTARIIYCHKNASLIKMCRTRLNCWWLIAFTWWAKDQGRPWKVVALGCFEDPLLMIWNMELNCVNAASRSFLSVDNGPISTLWDRMASFSNIASSNITMDGTFGIMAGARLRHACHMYTCTWSNEQFSWRHFVLWKLLWSRHKYQNENYRAAQVTDICHIIKSFDCDRTVDLITCTCPLSFSSPYFSPTKSREIAL
jgi:hypothetical protein